MVRSNENYSEDEYIEKLYESDNDEYTQKPIAFATKGKYYLIIN